MITEANGLELAWSTPAEFAGLLTKKLKRWNAIIRNADMKDGRRCSITEMQ